jgi:hypothetical protein
VTDIIPVPHDAAGLISQAPVNVYLNTDSSQICMGDLEAEYGTSTEPRTITSKYYDGKRAYVTCKSFSM